MKQIRLLGIIGSPRINSKIMLEEAIKGGI
jgi:hypothetical protein